MTNIEQLIIALKTCDIEANVFTYEGTSYEDGKKHHCTIVTTDFWTGEDNLEFIFNPETGKRVNTITQCPVVKQKEVKRKNKKKNNLNK